MSFADLELLPESGHVDVAAVEKRLGAFPHAFVDPHDSHCWFLCASEDEREHCLTQRLADTTRRPYAMLVLLDTSRVWLTGEFAQWDALRLARELVVWLVAHGRWKARDAAYSMTWNEDPLAFFEDVPDR